MTTLFDIGDIIEMNMVGRVKSYSTDRKDDDCYVVNLKDKSGEYNLPVYLDTKSLIASDAHLFGHARNIEVKPFVRGTKKGELIALGKALKCRYCAENHSRIPGERFDCKFCHYGKQVRVSDTEYLANIVCDKEKIFEDAIKVLDELIGE